MRTFIICPNLKCYGDYIIKNNIDIKTSIIIVNPEDIYGYTFSKDDIIVKTGTFNNFNNLIDIENYIADHTF